MKLYIYTVDLHHLWIFKQIWAPWEKWNWLGYQEDKKNPETYLVQQKETVLKLSD